jgi:protein-L-isoaspartate(D-aspartate) O-methyltransferase
LSLAARKIRLIMALRQSGITDTAVLAAIERIPRERFVPPLFHDQAYENRALPIGHGQTLSQPEVLEIGTGSGYQTGVLSRLARRVYTIERHKALLQAAEQRFAELRLHNITSRAGDGSRGWPEQCPFDRIIVTAAAPKVPAVLVQQLAVGGIIVVPIGPDRGKQTLVRITRTEGGEARETLGPVRFVPLSEDPSPGNGADGTPAGSSGPDGQSLA